MRSDLPLLVEELSVAACYEAEAPGLVVRGPSTGAHLPDGFDPVRSVSNVMTRRGPMPVLKILQTSACEKDCFYCPFRAGRDFRRATLTPDELAYAFDQMIRAGLVRGLFLSSGIVDAHRSMDRMLATVEILRRRYEYRGYVHLKLLPGVERAQIERAVALADRVSVNLEAPNPTRLERLAPHKEFRHALLGTLAVAAETIRRERAVGRKVVPAGTVTQFVVGPAGESDRELLSTVHHLYRARVLTRAYYSAFTPVPQTPLESVPPTSPMRELRLYQADFLLRFYGFRADELVYDHDGLLDQDRDPKLAWALSHPEVFPLDVNRADREQLLRVPGIGPKSADRIVAARRVSTLRDLGQLARLGVDIRRCQPFVLLDGRRPPVQLPLFPELRAAA